MKGAPAEPTVESRPGIVQVTDNDGPVLSETETCTRFRTALVANAQRLGCDSTGLLECPTLVQPLGSAECIVYSGLSVESCVTHFNEAMDCSGLIPGACVLTAHLDGTSPECAGHDAAVPDASPSTSGSSAAPTSTENTENSDAGATSHASSGEADAGVTDSGSSDGSVAELPDDGGGPFRDAN